ncbi:MAG: DinB family protein [Pseudomonadota bacterium]
MISAEHAQLMGRYNAWQNERCYAAADGLTDAQRRQDQQAFFGSLHGTLAHILWADRVWLHRFAGTPATIAADAQGLGPAYTDWDRLQAERRTFDTTINDWAATLSDDWLAADFTWTNVAGTRSATQPAWRLVAHLFNHQTHHRGQAHALLTGFGAATEDTDLLLLPS